MSETAAVVVHAVLAFVLIGFFGLWGVALAFAVLYLFVTALVSLIAFRLIRFHWSLPVLRMLFESSLFIGAAFLFAQVTQGVPGLLFGGVLSIAAFFYTARGLARRLGESHRLIQIMFHIPGGSWLCKA